MLFRRAKEVTEALHGEVDEDNESYEEAALEEEFVEQERSALLEGGADELEQRFEEAAASQSPPLDRSPIIGESYVRDDLVGPTPEHIGENERGAAAVEDRATRALEGAPGEEIDEEAFDSGSPTQSSLTRPQRRFRFRRDNIEAEVKDQETAALSGEEPLSSPSSGKDADLLDLAPESKRDEGALAANRQDLEDDASLGGSRRRFRFRRDELEAEVEDQETAALSDEEEPAVKSELSELPAPAEPVRRRLRLARTRSILRGPLLALRARGRVDERTLEDLEDALLMADVGLSTTRLLLDSLREKIRSRELDGASESLISFLERSIVELFDGQDLSLHRSAVATTVWLFVGVNGVGKTTTIGKLAHREVVAGRRVVLAAGDTFRAAAREQLALWATSSGASIVQGADGADPSSVVFDAVQHAHARGFDVVMADSAGRLHNKANLMEELKKITRIAGREPGELTEVLLVLDATTGQNGLVQARQFAEAVGVTGVILTKLDGSAKGGIVLSICHDLGLPIKLVGVGEAVEDLIDFEPEDFAAALLSTRSGDLDGESPLAD